MTLDSEIKACFDIILPPELNEIARQKAFEENPSNVSPFEAAAVSSKLWRVGRTLTVGFLDGQPEVQRLVKHYASEWEKYANIRFEFIDSQESDIRISFNRVGSWSALGTDALVEQYFPKHEPTMNFGWLNGDSGVEESSRVILHEFGHALGMIHEHTNPIGGINWDKQTVYRSLSGPPNNWNKAKVDYNMFTRYSVTQTQFTSFDPDSIMLYTIPSGWTVDKVAYHAKNVLSPVDKEFIRARYPAG